MPWHHDSLLLSSQLALHILVGFLSLLHSPPRSWEPPGSFCCKHRSEDFRQQNPSPPPATSLMDSFKERIAR